MQEPVLVLVSVWWIVFTAAVGLTLGSYLNVVIFRIPRGISTTLPRWSFCPNCHSRIHWYDNLPVLSYIRLGGRCRSCGARISPQYPVIELLTATITLVLLDAFCIAHLRPGLLKGFLGLTEQLWSDWPILLAHMVLFACLLAMSVIDLEYYFIDIRFTNFAALVGFILHALWTPLGSREWHRPGVTTAAVSVATLLGLAGVWLVMRLLIPAHEGPSSDEQDSSCPSNPDPGVVTPQNGPTVETPAGPARSRAGGLGLLIAILTFLGVGMAAGMDAISPEADWGSAWRLLIPLVVVFAFVVGAGAPARDSDTEIVEAIESERGSARLVAFQELLLLGPAAVCGALTLWLCLTKPAFHAWAGTLLNWSPVGAWRPLLGLATAASGYVIGGGIGWLVRIGFTLLLRREAFGSGDIHLMAAAGCVGGWPVAVLGFFLTSFLALVGWVSTLPFKKTKAIPLVPWLSLAFLAVVVFLEPILRWGPVRNVQELAELLLLRNNSQGR